MLFLKNYAAPVHEPATTIKKLIKEFGVSVDLYWSQRCNFEAETSQIQSDVLCARDLDSSTPDTSVRAAVCSSSEQSF